LARYKPFRNVAALLALFALVLPLLAACGGTAAPAGSATAPADTSSEPTAATAAEPTAATAAEPTSAGEATAAPTSEGAAEPTAATEGDAAATPEAQPIGEQLDPTQLSPGVAVPEGEITLTFASWVGETDTMQKLAEEFHELYPNITIDFQGIPAEEMHDKMLTQVAGGTAPDVAYLDQSQVGEFASRNALLDLDPYIALSSAVKPDDYIAAFRDAATYQGKMYGLPFDGESTGLFYRTDLFEAAGISGPPTNWQEFEEYAQKLTDKEKKQYGFILFAPEAAYYWYPWLWQAGGRLLSEDGKQIAFNNEDGKRAGEFYARMRDYAPEDFFNSNSYDGRVAFANGTVAMYVAGAWFAGTLKSEFPDIDGKWAAAPLPKDKQCATTIAGDTLVIFSQSKNKEAAWKWIEFLSTPQNMALWNLGTASAPGSLLPPRTSLLEDPRAFENNDILKGFAEQMECGVANATNNENWGQAEQFLNEALGKAIYGEVDAATALDQAAQEAQAVLAP
jgi:multiple sugar transport system substrate-binding protein